MRVATSFMFGIAVGAMTILLVQRLQQTVLEEDAEALANRLSEQLASLEGRAHPEGARPTPARPRGPRSRAG